VRFEGRAQLLFGQLCGAAGFFVELLLTAERIAFAG
jgi:hypothetical protein